MKPLILLADDDSEMRYALSETLTRCGFTVDMASGGAEAVEKFFGKQFDMVITDIKMAQADGMHVLREIKKRSQNTPVVLMTAYGTIDNAVQAMKLGAFDYLMKPFSVEALEDVVRRVIDSMSAANAPDQGKRPKQEIVTQDARMTRLLKIAGDIAASNVTVLIEGESGTGKEMLTRFIHSRSARSSGPFVAINCAAIPDGLLESELFGYERGAFTGALNKRNGKFIQAHTGTLLLDEISEMSLQLQAKLLRVLQERQVDTIGGREPVDVDIRVIATTNRSLKREVEEGRFREDLYYRLNVFPVTLPPLRERRADIPHLVEHFLRKHRDIGIRGNRSTMIRISREAVNELMKHDWKGNIRELENTVERSILMAEGDTILPEDLIIDARQEMPRGASAIQAGLSVSEMEKALIMKTLDEVSGNRTKAARLLGIGVRTLRNKLKEYREETGGRNCLR